MFWPKMAVAKKIPVQFILSLLKFLIVTIVTFSCAKFVFGLFLYHVIIESSPPGHVDIILYARYRGGSTFSGEFLNKHGDIAFIYEPLCKDRYGGTVEDIHGVLDSVMECKFHGTEAMKQVHPPWYHYQAFCILPEQTPGCNKKLRIKLPAAEKYCQEMPHKAIKVIRVRSVEQLERYMQKGTKVVHLLRDPRGTVHSRSKIDRKLDWASNSVEYCDEAVRDLMKVQEAYRSRNRLFTDNYHLVRYEDLAAHPVEELLQLYKFIGIAPDRRVTDWALLQATKTQTFKDNGNKTDHLKKSHSKNGMRSIYTTFRDNPAYTAEAWRLDINMQQVKTVQGMCKEFMRYFGYAELTDEKHKEDMMRSVVLPLDKNELFKSQSPIDQE